MKLFNYAFICSILFIILLVQPSIQSVKQLNEEEEPEEKQNAVEDRIFEATDEFRPVPKGYSITSGLHVRMNFETGEIEAKKIAEEEEKNSEATAIIKTEEASSVKDSEEEVAEDGQKFKSLEEALSSRKFTPEESMERSQVFYQNQVEYVDGLSDLLRHKQSLQSLISKCKIIPKGNADESDDQEPVTDEHNATAPLFRDRNGQIPYLQKFYLCRGKSEIMAVLEEIKDLVDHVELGYEWAKMGGFHLVLDFLLELKEPSIDQIIQPKEEQEKDDQGSNKGGKGKIKIEFKFGSANEEDPFIIESIKNRIRTVAGLMENEEIEGQVNSIRSLCASILGITLQSNEKALAELKEHDLIVQSILDLLSAPAYSPPENQSATNRTLTNPNYWKSRLILPLSNILKLSANSSDLLTVFTADPEGSEGISALDLLERVFLRETRAIRILNLLYDISLRSETDPIPSRRCLTRLFSLVKSSLRESGVSSVQNLLVGSSARIPNGNELSNILEIIQFLNSQSSKDSSDTTNPSSDPSNIDISSAPLDEVQRIMPLESSGAGGDEAATTENGEFVVVEQAIEEMFLEMVQRNLV